MTAINPPPDRSVGPAPADASNVITAENAVLTDNLIDENCRRASLPTSGRLVHVARSLEQVERAWRLVHDAYADLGLINANVHRIHTVPEAVHPAAAVIAHDIDGQTHATLTVMPDCRAGLPLDAIYPTELGKLRSNGQRLVEIGLLADTTTKASQSATVIIEMMRHAFWFAWLHKANILIGVHPRHVGFYCRYFGFQTIGDESTHPTVNHWPVVPLYIPVDQTLQQTKWPKGVAALVRAPMPLGAFSQRTRLTREAVVDTAVGRYLDDKAELVGVRAA